MKFKNYQIPVILIFYILGIISAKYINVIDNILLYSIFIITIALATIIYLKENSYLIILFLLAIFSGNLITNLNFNKNADLLASLTQREVILTGEVLKRNKLTNDYISFELKSHSLKYKNIELPVNGTYLVKLYDYNGYKDFKKEYSGIIVVGNTILIEGKFQEKINYNFLKEFNTQTYLSDLGLSGIFENNSGKRINIIKRPYLNFSNKIDELRIKLSEFIEYYHSPSASYILKSLLLGDRSDIPEETTLSYINAGVIHVLAISGLHINILLFVLYFLTGRFNKYVRSLIVLLVLLFFIFLTGSSPSVVRASVMTFFWIIYKLLERQENGLNVLCVAAFFTLIYQPLNLFNSGFQLSYLTVLSILLFNPLLSKVKYLIKHYDKNKLIKYFIDGIFLTISAQILILPLLVILFKKISLISVITNLCIIPFTAITIMISIFEIIVFYFSPFLFFIIKNMLEIIIGIQIFIIDYLGKIKYVFLELNSISIISTFFYYLSFLFILYSTHNFKRRVIIYTVLIVVITNIGLFIIDNSSTPINNKSCVYIYNNKSFNSLSIITKSQNKLFIDVNYQEFDYDNFKQNMIKVLKVLKRLSLNEKIIIITNLNENLIGDEIRKHLNRLNMNMVYIYKNLESDQNILVKKSKVIKESLLILNKNKWNNLIKL